MRKIRFFVGFVRAMLIGGGLLAAFALLIHHGGSV